MKFAGAFLGHLVLLGAFFWWTGIGDDTRGQVALSVAVAVLWLIALLALEWWLFRGARWRTAVQRGTFWTALVYVLASAAVARLIMADAPISSKLSIRNNSPNPSRRFSRR